jgi:glycosyltransferase involved in cell wall biosynthesis
MSEAFMLNSQKERATCAVVYPAIAGQGGLGHSAASALAALARDSHEVIALGPGFSEPWSLGGAVPNCQWLRSPKFVPAWKRKYTPLRWRSGELTMQHDRALGWWAAGHVRARHPGCAYVFTQVGLETLRWTNQQGIFSTVDNPNGHIQNYREVCERESQRWFGRNFRGHPASAMVERVTEEYELADCVRVYSEWGKESMMRFGMAADKIKILRQTINLDRFQAPALKAPPAGPLRICYVGTLDLRKGFVYLLRAIRALGAHRVTLEMVGATGERDCARLLQRERQGLQVQCAPGDPMRAYQSAELFVLPTLEDGLPFVLPEAMACGLPVIVTDQCGAGECVREDREGWIVPAADAEALAAALEKALARRKDLPEMGRNARRAIEGYCGAVELQQLADWFYSHSAPVV